MTGIQSVAPGPPFSITTEIGAARTTVLIQGELDMATAASCRDELATLPAQTGHVIVLDVAGMTFIDSTGLGAIVGCLKRVREGGGDLVLRRPTNATRRVLEITGLDEIIAVED